MIGQHCPVCQKLFQTSFYTKKYCNKKCAKKAQKSAAQARFRQLRDANKLEKYDLLPNEKYCKECGSKFKFKFNGEKYCNSQCRIEGNAKAALARQELAQKNKAKNVPVFFLTCIECGEVFQSNRRRSICSDECRHSRVRSKYIKNFYGLSREDHEKMLKKQNNKCAICLKQETLVVDHCHSSQQVRGLLCNSCNLGLGCFFDNTKSLSRAVKYLTKASQQE